MHTGDFSPLSPAIPVPLAGLSRDAESAHRPRKRALFLENWQKALVESPLICDRVTSRMVAGHIPNFWGKKVPMFGDHLTEPMAFFMLATQSFTIPNLSWH